MNFKLDSERRMRVMKVRCRICLEEGDNNTGEGNEFISPCKCNGNLEYVHENCIALWIRKNCNEDECAGKG